MPSTSSSFNSIVSPQKLQCLHKWHVRTITLLNVVSINHGCHVWQHSYKTIMKPKMYYVPVLIWIFICLNTQSWHWSYVITEKIVFEDLHVHKDPIGIITFSHVSFTFQIISIYNILKGLINMSHFLYSFKQCIDFACLF